MEQTSLMTEVERVSHRCDDFRDILFGHAARVLLSDQMSRVSAIHVVHRDPEPAVELATIENANDMWVPQRRGQFGLAVESRPEFVVVRRGRRQDLERVLPRQPRVLGEVDLTHTTGSEQPLNDVASENLTVVERHPRSLQPGRARPRIPPLTKANPVAASRSSSPIDLVDM